MQLEYGHLLCRWSSYWLRSSKPGIVRCSCTFYWELDQYPDSDNNISGNIPSEIGKLSKLQNLDLSNNNFCGQIPTTFSHLKNLEFLRLTGNNLSGEIPASLANLTDLHLIDLSFNNLSGKVPIFPAQVFNIEGNPYLYTKGTDKVDKGSLPNSSKAKLNKSGIFYVITILMVPYYYSHLWDSSFFI
ncbi:hypothetical protein ES288_D02G163300v1 [Gossypium darwinii]|uniref:Leucine-rich repeat-containing N-terminal plant-type domain-containing protein n=1 Tax=Gossypium darwinii TaxID=34276 RepID=A0A5D2DD82_GOSDA|nr:hypothetical protein ES288_D02G163300v1 [Gossypium darwinii]